MKFNKKASMELGISTVVVLVIAMVIIAGGIAFIRGFFKLGEDKLGGAFNVGDFGIQPTSSDPLVLTDGTTSMKSGATKEVKVGFYNKANSDLQVNIVLGSCVSTVLNTACSDSVPVMQSLPQSVKVGESAGFKTYVTANCAHPNTLGEIVKLVPGEYICQLKATNADDATLLYEESQITLSILS